MTHRFKGSTSKLTAAIYTIAFCLCVLSLEPAQAGDTEIALNVQRAFMKDPYLFRLNIITYIANGEVVLGGHVHTSAEKSRAEEIAASVPGVAQVHNKLIVIHEDQTQKSDREIERSIQEKLSQHALPDLKNIELAVDNATVTLVGIVETAYAVVAAQTVAHEGGAKLVRNDLKVRDTFYRSPSRAPST